MSHSAEQHYPLAGHALDITLDAENGQSQV
jgi:hypothetical protein